MPLYTQGCADTPRCSVCVAQVKEVSFSSCSSMSEAQPWRHQNEGQSPELMPHRDTLCCFLILISQTPSPFHQTKVMTIVCDRQKEGSGLWKSVCGVGKAQCGRYMNGISLPYIWNPLSAWVRLSFCLWGLWRWCVCLCARACVHSGSLPGSISPAD